MIWTVMSYLLAFVVVAVVIAGATTVRARMRRPEWAPDSFCANPVCGDPIFDHQSETPDGACARVGCPCDRFEHG